MYVLYVSFKRNIWILLRMSFIILNFKLKHIRVIITKEQQNYVMVFNFQGSSSYSSSSIYVYSANSVYPLRLYQFGTIVWLLILLQTEYKCLVAAQGNQGGNNNLRQGYVHLRISRSFTFMTLQVYIFNVHVAKLYTIMCNY